MNVLEQILLLRKLKLSEVFDVPEDFRNSEEVRKWLQADFRVLDALAQMTATKTDDKVVDAVQGVLENDQAWSIIHNLVCDVVDAVDVFTGAETPDVVASVGEAAKIAGVSPTLIISIVQAIITLLGLIKKKRVA